MHYYSLVLPFWTYVHLRIYKLILCYSSTQIIIILKMWYFVFVWLGWSLRFLLLMESLSNGKKCFKCKNVSWEEVFICFWEHKMLQFCKYFQASSRVFLATTNAFSPPPLTTAKHMLHSKFWLLQFSTASFLCLTPLFLSSYLLCFIFLIQEELDFILEKKREKKRWRLKWQFC